ncbi:UDP-glucose 6-dehydrogenase [Pseudoclavibacter endophyticus]|uniref:UDP-glucose 6-dehydrogenase n=1 Tax=Pseudoclavibacter endophyticus TaxID=1778590 RepID=A0A6H9WL90_9MICO|nr:UDP-glucose/GDP-mannose dehydrogenase family protein [Pseudoclavibacter endophyticus]KAB1646682.1 UDP-glucose/GDP-mannose dehydrogenase family protein [Pseudoclavibacter endophyticus]GGA76514.1 UDP-glucose 6-dehydrogenase [Pseudoclavibacter endophyticus]
MRISVIGCGYLGAVHAAGMASLGHDVIGIDIDARKVEALTRGEAPFFEPGLPELLREQVDSGRLRFSTDLELARGARVHFLGVGTPQQRDSDAADLTYVDAAIAGLARIVGPGEVVVGKSTVPVGTASRLLECILDAQPDASLAWNPEFLREGFAVTDTLRPDRLVYGVRGGDDAEREAGERDAALLDEVYADLLEADTPRLLTDLATAELVKVSANAFLATKISFINAMAEICEQTGADVTMLADAIGLDPRIGRRFLNSGLGFGGGCLPKDIRAFQARANELGVGESLHFLREVDGVNQRRRARVVELTRELTGGHERLDGITVGVLGLAFKPNSDDTRDSPALDVARQLLDLGATVRGYDPEASANAARVVPELALTDSPAEALRGADIAIVATEWQEFRDLDPASPELRDTVASARIIDARNCLDATAWRAAGWTLRALGRGTT